MNFCNLHLGLCIFVVINKALVRSSNFCTMYLYRSLKNVFKVISTLFDSSKNQQWTNEKKNLRHPILITVMYYGTIGRGYLFLSIWRMSRSNVILLVSKDDRIKLIKWSRYLSNTFVQYKLLVQLWSYLIESCVNTIKICINCTKAH